MRRDTQWVQCPAYGGSHALRFMKIQCSWISPILPKVQERIYSGCNKTENASKRKARRIKRRACFLKTIGCRLCLYFTADMRSPVGRLAWRWTCASLRCGKKWLRSGQRKAIIRTHLLSEISSDYIGLVWVVIQNLRILSKQPNRNPAKRIRFGEKE